MHYIASTYTNLHILKADFHIEQELVLRFDVFIGIDVPWIKTFILFALHVCAMNRTERHGSTDKNASKVLSIRWESEISIMVRLM